MSRPLAFRRGGTLHWVGAQTTLGGTIRVLNDSFTALDAHALQALRRGPGHWECSGDG